MDPEQVERMRLESGKDGKDPRHHPKNAHKPNGQIQIEAIEKKLIQP